MDGLDIKITIVTVFLILLIFDASFLLEENEGDVVKALIYCLHKIHSSLSICLSILGDSKPQTVFLTETSFAASNVMVQFPN